MSRAINTFNEKWWRSFQVSLPVHGVSFSPHVTDRSRNHVGIYSPAVPNSLGTSNICSKLLESCLPNLERGSFPTFDKNIVFLTIKVFLHTILFSPPRVSRPFAVPSPGKYLLFLVLSLKGYLISIGRGFLLHTPIGSRMLPYIYLISLLYLLVQGLPSLLGHELQGQGLLAMFLLCPSPGMVSSTEGPQRKSGVPWSTGYGSSWPSMAPRNASLRLEVLFLFFKDFTFNFKDYSLLLCS